MTYRILAVDDDPQTTGALKRLLEARGYAVREENDPREALQAAREFQPHVVLLDYLMPSCDGGDVAWQLWSDRQLHNVKVVVCSAAVKAEIAERLPPGSIPILEKPLDTRALLGLIKRWTTAGTDPG